MSSLTGIKVFIDSKRLVAFRVSDDGGKKVKEKLFDSKLEKNNLPQLLQELKEKTQVANLDLLFADDLVVSGIIQDESNSVTDRESIGRLVKTKLSIATEKTVWDYTKINDYYQIVCLPDNFSSHIAPAFEKAGIKVESIEPLSVSLAKLLSSRTEPVVVVYDDVERLVTVCWQGLVFEPTLFVPVELSNKAKKLKQNFAKDFSREVKEAIVSSAFADPYLADLSALSLATQVGSLDPFTGVATLPLSAEQADSKEVVEDVAVKTVIDIESEKPENYTNIWQEKSPPEAKPEEVVKVEENKEVLKDSEPMVDITIDRDSSIKPKRNLTWMAFAIPLLITLIVVGYLLIGNKNKGDLYNPLIESSVSGTTASTSATLSAKASLKIQVLNGSGKTGEAAKVKGLLEKAGFTVGAVGNATTSSVIKTEIKSTAMLSEMAIKGFQDSLSTLYDTTFTVAPVVGFDVVVTVGKSK